MAIERAIAIGITRSGKPRANRTKNLGINAIKFRTKPVIKAGSPTVKLKIVIALKPNKIIGARKIAPRRSRIGATGLKNVTARPNMIDKISSGNPIDVNKVGSPTNNMKPKKSSKAIVMRIGRLSIMKVIILGNKVPKYVNNVIKNPGRAAS